MLFKVGDYVETDWACAGVERGEAFTAIDWLRHYSFSILHARSLQLPTLIT